MELYVILDYIRLGSEALAALVGLIYLPRLKNSYWKWLAVYLILIFIQEMFWFNRNSFQGLTDNDFFAFFGIPVQMLFPLLDQSAPYSRDDGTVEMQLSEVTEDAEGSA